MNEDRALSIGMVVIGAGVVIANAAAGGPVGGGETIGMCMVLFGIRSWRSTPSLPQARLVRSR
jgi:hypothetical protein